MHRNFGHTQQRTNAGSGSFVHTGSGAARARAVAADDPFGPDGFGDTWGKPKHASFDSDSDSDADRARLVPSSLEEQKQQRLHRRLVQAKLDQERREFREELEARSLKTKAAQEAAALGALKQQHSAEVACSEWRSRVKDSLQLLALAKPKDALHALYSLFADDDILYYIPLKEVENIASMTEALELHFELQQCFRFAFDGTSQDASSSLNSSIESITTVDKSTTHYITEEEESTKESGQ